MKLVGRLVLLLLALQVTATVALWSLSPTGPTSQAIFAALLAVDLLAFAMVSYLYRMGRAARGFDRRWVLAGCGMFALLLVAALFLA